MEDWELISVYTSEDGIEDGILIGLKQLGIKESKINLMTSSVYMQYKNLGCDEAKSKIEDLIERAETEMSERDDWFYNFKYKDKKYFVAQNETGKYTLMLPEDY